MTVLQACQDSFPTHHGMMFHITQKHKSKKGLFHCIFNADCEPTNTSKEMATHIFGSHFDALP